MFKLLIVSIILLLGDAQEDLVLLTKKRTSFLENFRGYTSLAISQVEIPSKVSFASFKLSAEPFDLSIFGEFKVIFILTLNKSVSISGCSPETVYIYLKKGSIPVLNPDDSKIPKWVRNITKSELYGLELLTDKKYSYINITSPQPGLYYFAAFFPYVDPNKVAIKQKGIL